MLFRSSDNVNIFIRASLIAFSNAAYLCVEKENMIDLSIAIISSVSVAGIAKGYNIVEYLTEFYTPLLSSGDTAS